MQLAEHRDVIHIAPLPSEKPLVFEAVHRPPDVATLVRVVWDMFGIHGALLHPDHEAYQTAKQVVVRGTLPTSVLTISTMPDMARSKWKML
jgi:hypothetical protein